MEPSGRNQWQPVADALAPKDGKEGVDFQAPPSLRLGTRIPQTSPASPTTTTLHPAHIPREDAGSFRRRRVIPAPGRGVRVDALVASGAEDEAQRRLAVRRCCDGQLELVAKLADVELEE